MKKGIFILTILLLTTFISVGCNKEAVDGVYEEFLYAIGIVVVFTVFTLWFWKLGLRNYKSASS